MTRARILALALILGCDDGGDTSSADGGAGDGGGVDGGGADGGGDGGLSGTVEVDLGTDPVTGATLPDGTVLADQYRSVGILFDAQPAEVDPVVAWWGEDEASLFFDPDVAEAVAVFRFVEPGTDTAVDVQGFTLEPWFNPGESAELVGLDATGAQVALATVTPADIGDDSQGIPMQISGTFRVVEWRTHGNPGISAGDLAFTW